MPGFLGGNKAAAGGVPPGMNLKNALIQAAPLFASMAAGYSSGRGPYAYMDQGIASIQANQKAKRDEEAAAAAAAAFGNLRPGGMGAAGGGGGGGGTPFVYEPSKPMPKADLGGISGMGEAGIGFAGLPKADMGMLGATDGLGFTVPGSGDPTLGLIKSFEGFQETPYWDVNALRTGYGSDTVTLPDGTVQKVGEGTRVSQEDADRDLQRRVSTEFAPIAARAVGEDVFESLLPNQKAALTSIAYNYGELPSSVAEAVRSGDPQAAAAAIAALGSHNNGINAGRRSKEAAFYLSGSTGGGAAPAAPAGPVDPMSDPYVQQLMAVMAMPGMTPEQQAVIQMQLQSRNGMLTAPQPGAEEEAARAMRERDADLLGYTRGSPEWNQYYVTGEMPAAADPMDALNLEKAQLEIDALKNPMPDAGAVFDSASDLRKEWIGMPAVKAFEAQSAAMARLEAAATDPSAAGDMAMLYGYMKLLDPGSVVRETEFATAAASGSLPEQIQGYATKLLNGQRLTPEQRADFLNRAKMIYQGAETEYDEIRNQYIGIAERNKLPVDDAVPDFRYSKGITSSDLAVGAVEDGYRYIGGDPSLPTSWEAVQ